MKANEICWFLEVISILVSQTAFFYAYSHSRVPVHFLSKPFFFQQEKEVLHLLVKRWGSYWWISKHKRLISTKHSILHQNVSHNNFQQLNTFLTTHNTINLLSCLRTCLFKMAQWSVIGECPHKYWPPGFSKIYSNSHFYYKPVNVKVTNLINLFSIPCLSNRVLNNTVLKLCLIQSNFIYTWHIKS